MATIRLLLRESIENLGTIGDIVEVTAGFGRNYLVPSGKGVAVTKENLRLIDVRKVELVEEETKKKQDLAKIAAILGGKSFNVAARAAGDEGKLYGSVSSADVAAVLKADGFPVEAKMVLLDRPIKELGIFEVRIRLFPGVETTTKVWVVEDTTAEAEDDDEE